MTIDKPWKDRDTLMELRWEQGLTNEEIADKFNIHRETVNSGMKDNNVPRSLTDYINDDSERFEEFRRLYSEEEMPLEELGERYYRSRRCVQRTRKELGIEKRDGDHKFDTYPDDVKWKQEDWLREQVREEGLTYMEIAEEVGVSKTTIGKYCRRYDIEPNKKNYRWYSEQELIEWMEMFIVEFGGIPSLSLLNQCPGPSATTYINRFGSIEKGINATQFQSKEFSKVSMDELESRSDNQKI